MNKDLKNKILAAAKKKGLNQSDLLSKINISQPGFDRMFLNDSMKLRTLEDIAQVLELPLSYFLGDATASQVNEPQEKYGVYEKLLQAKEETIEVLKSQIKMYENQLNNKFKPA